VVPYRAGWSGPFLGNPPMSPKFCLLLDCPIFTTLQVVDVVITIIIIIIIILAYELGSSHLQFPLSLEPLQQPFWLWLF
jgi:hypothetical protein